MGKTDSSNTVDSGEYTFKHLSCMPRSSIFGVFLEWPLLLAFQGHLWWILYPTCLHEYFAWYFESVALPYTANSRSWTTFGPFPLLVRNLNSQNLCLCEGRLIYIVSMSLSWNYIYNIQRHVRTRYNFIILHCIVPLHCKDLTLPFAFMPSMCSIGYFVFTRRFYLFALCGPAEPPNVRPTDFCD
jgi:hypothetical protein